MQQVVQDTLRIMKIVKVVISTTDDDDDENYPLHGQDEDHEDRHTYTC